MKGKKAEFNLDNIHPVELNLLDGQVELILRALELYGYNLEYMLSNVESADESRQTKLALLKYTYEQILSSQAEQVYGKTTNIEDLTSNLGKILLTENKFEGLSEERNFNVV